MSDDAFNLGPFCAFKDYRRRGRRRPGQWTWRARYRRSQRLFAAWNAANNRASIRAETAAFKGPRGPINRFRHKEPRP
jgi:hypothetical protein